MRVPVTTKMLLYDYCQDIHRPVAFLEEQIRTFGVRK